MDEFISHITTASSTSNVGFFRMEKLKGNGIIKRAARHNRREIQAELGSSANINPSLTHQNETLCGPATAGEVVLLAERLMAEAGVSIARHDAIHALEIVFSLPANTAFDDRRYFVECVMWVVERFGGAENILSADIHRDESQRHCHVLILPLLNGKLNGAKMIGYRTQLKEMHLEFHAQVAARYGLKKAPARLNGAAKSVVSSGVLKKLNDAADPALKSGIWLTIREAIEAGPVPFALALGLQIHAPSSRMKTTAQIFTSKGKGPSIERKGIDFRAVEEKQSLCSVDFQLQDPPASPPAQHSENIVRAEGGGLFDPETGEYYDCIEPTIPAGGNA